jgi:hypothetical protein
MIWVTTTFASPPGEERRIGPLQYDPTNPEASRYNVGRMSDFDQDLVAWSGNWIIAPSTALVQATYLIKDQVRLPS